MNASTKYVLEITSSTSEKTAELKFDCFQTMYSHTQSSRSTFSNIPPSFKYTIPQKTKLWEFHLFFCLCFKATEHANTDLMGIPHDVTAGSFLSKLGNQRGAMLFL